MYIDDDDDDDFIDMDTVAVFKANASSLSLYFADNEYMYKR